MRILSKPKGNAEEYGRWSVNPYKGCTHGCKYCYLKDGAWANNLGGSVPVLKKHIVSNEHAFHVAMAEIIENREQIIKDGGLFMTFTSDPCIEKTRELMFRIAAHAIEDGVCVTILTKNADFFQFETVNRMLHDVPKMNLTREEMGKMVHEGMLFMTYFGNLRSDITKRRVAFGWTLTGHDEMEPNASPNAYRIQTMGRMHADGFKTWASIEPVIDFDSSYDMIYKALDAGCTHFKIGLMTKKTKVCRNGFTIDGQTFKPYDIDELLNFVEDVMRLTEGRATVYWKQSFYDLFAGEPINGMTAQEFFHQWPHSVDKDWSMFNVK